MKILLTGASGYVGARIYFDLKSYFHIIGTYFSNRLSQELIQLDITDKSQVKKVIGDIKPEVIVHVANSPSSQWCEANPGEAIKLNQTSTEYLLDVANKNNIKIVYVSTMGAIIPKDLYQKTKAASEKTVKLAQAGYLILRPSVGIGCSPNTTSDNFFNKLLDCIEHKEQAVFDTSLKLQPTHVAHISQVIQKSLEKDMWNLTIPISVSEMRSRYDIAKDLLEQFGVKVTPFNEHIPPFNSVEGVDNELKKLGLPSFSYEQVIERTISEIKNRSNFVI